MTFFVGVSLALIGGFCFLCYGLIYGIARFLSPKLAAVAGALIVAYLIYSIVDMYIACGQEPEYIPPQLGESGEGRMVHACDGPTGMVAYFWMIIFGPGTALVIGLFTFWVFRKFTRIPKREA